GCFSPLGIWKFVIGSPQHERTITVPCWLIGEIFSGRIFIPMDFLQSQFVPKSTLPLLNNLRSWGRTFGTDMVKDAAKPTLSWSWSNYPHRNTKLGRHLLELCFPVPRVISG